MKKDIEWLKEEMECMHKIRNTDLHSDTWFISKDAILEALNQLDESERPIELQELIDKYSKDTMSTYEVKVEREKFVKDLQNLLVPEREELTDEHFEVEVGEKSYWVHEEAFNQIYDDAYMQGEADGERKSKPVIPQFVADWIEDKKDKYGRDILEIGYDFYHSDLDDFDVDDWVEDNPETFARAWLDGFTVEEEQKYVIKLDDESYLQRYEIDNKNIVTPFRIVGHLKEVAIKFDNKERAEKVAELVEGKVEELEE